MKGAGVQAEMTHSHSTIDKHYHYNQGENIITLHGQSLPHSLCSYTKATHTHTHRYTHSFTHSLCYLEYNCFFISSYHSGLHYISIKNMHEPLKNNFETILTQTITAGELSLHSCPDKTTRADHYCLELVKVTQIQTS